MITYQEIKSGWLQELAQTAVKSQAGSADFFLFEQTEGTFQTDPITKSRFGYARPAKILTTTLKILFCGY
ncbi:MAG: hypothetical protein AAB645_02070 [Patescibacteria group bacterium]